MEINNIDLEAWVAQAKDAEQQEFREAVHTILVAIASDPVLQADMVIKGGILLAIRFGSSRFTKDIDFSTRKTSAEIKLDNVVDRLSANLAITVERLDYDLDCLIQNYKINPDRIDATFPTIQLKIGHAYKDTPKHRRLLSKQSPSVVAIDYSLNEKTQNVDSLLIDNGEPVQAYALSDVVAEKYRSLLQQVERQRRRRQDVYDLYLLLSEYGEQLEKDKKTILLVLLEKSRARGIEPTMSSLDEDEIKSRAQNEYHTLADEIDGDLPDFGMAYDKIAVFYRSLGW